MVISDACQLTFIIHAFAYESLIPLDTLEHKVPFRTFVSFAKWMELCMGDGTRPYVKAISRSANNVSARGVHSVATSVVGESIAACLRSEGMRAGHVFILCTEPGMGKTSAISYVINSMDSRANKVKYVDLSSSASGNATSRIVKTCRDMVRSKTPDNTVVVAFDNVPASDENEVLKQARAIRKASQNGSNVVLSILPEAEPLLEELSDAICYRAQDFVIPSFADGGGFRSSDEVIASFTHGIPRLVRAVQFVPESNIPHLETDGRYLSALSRVVTDAVRPSLIDEEREIRLAMIELGSGTVRDLDAVVDELDLDLLEAIACDALVFGLDLSAGTFACAGVSHLEGLRGTLQALERAADGFEELSRRTCELLVSRGDYARAGLLAHLCDSQDKARIVLGHAPEFMDCGCRGVIEDCIRLAASSGEDLDILEARLAISCLVDGKRDFEELRSLASKGATKPSASLEMLLASRDALSGRTPEGSLPEGGGRSTLQKTLAAFVSATGLLAEFRFSETFSYLLGTPERLERPSVSNALLWIEYAVAIYLSGSTPTPEDMQGFRRAAYFAAGSGVPFLSLAFSAVGPIASVLMGHSEHEPLLETCVQRSAFMGNGLVGASCLAVAAIADQRSGAGARAFVRLGQASDLALSCGATALSCACHLLACAVKSSLGERVMAGEVLDRRMPTELAMVARALAAVVDRTGGARLSLMGETREDACPEGMVWLVNTLSRDFGTLSVRFRNVIPRSWVGQVERVADSVGKVLAAKSARVQEEADKGDHGESYEVELSLLGGFHVAVNGVPVSEARFERRRAKSLLVLLGVVRGHVARRFEVMETVWPEFDFHDARQRVYEATSVLRGELTTKLGIAGFDPLVSNRGASTIGLDLDLVRCDVDEFESLAKKVLAAPKGQARETLATCARIQELYHGDLFVPSVDGAGIIEQRRIELRELYTDAMVLASSRALDLARPSLAVRYARIASEADPLREDAEIALVKALGASGRRMDAEHSYQEFAERMVGDMKRPPSRELRAAYQAVMDGAEGQGTHVEDREFGVADEEAEGDQDQTEAEG